MRKGDVERETDRERMWGKREQVKATPFQAWFICLSYTKISRISLQIYK